VSGAGPVTGAGGEGGPTFVFTDIEGSTGLLQELRHTYGLLVRIHRRILQTCFEERRGRSMGTEGDGVFYVFTTPDEAIGAAVTAQQKLEHYEWPEGVRLRVRMGVHRGPVTLSGGEYVGLTVHEVARICATSHGGQIVCSAAVAGVLAPTWPAGSFRALGDYDLRGIPSCHPLYQVCAEGLEDDFPPPREAVRAGGSRVTVWLREEGPAPTVARAGTDLPDLAALGVSLLGDPDDGGIEVEVRRSSQGRPGAFRVVVRCHGEVEEEYDGLTVGGATDVAAVVNGHSRLVRIGRR